MLASVTAKPFLHCHHRFKNGKDHCYWSIAEKVRTARGWVQRHILYLGEINDSQKEAWTKVTDVFDTARDHTRPLALYPAERAVPEHASEYGVQVRLGEFVLRRPRQWGAAGWDASYGISCSWRSFGATGCLIRGRALAGGMCSKR
jgi:hypothetical protein